MKNIHDYYVGGQTYTLLHAWVVKMYLLFVDQSFSTVTVMYVLATKKEMDKPRVGYLHHKIDYVRPGDHIYIHEYGGLTNKHGIVVRLNGELRVVHWCKKSERILSSSLDAFRNGKSIRLAQYNQSKVKKLFTRKGTSFIEQCKSPPEVQQTALSALLESVNDHATEDSRNSSESFALLCTTRSIALLVEEVNEDETQEELAIEQVDESDIRSAPQNQRANILNAEMEFNGEPIEDASHCNSDSSSFSLAVVNQVFTQRDNSKDRVRYWNHKIDPVRLEPGDHIYAYRFLGFYHHHGIYIGTNAQGIHIVIHFTGDRGMNSFDSISSAKIRRSPLDEFLNGKKLRLVSYNDDSILTRTGTTQEGKCLPAAEVVRTAEYYAENPKEWKKYNLLENNCEKFAIYCKTGKKENGMYTDQTQNIFLSPFVSVYYSWGMNF